MFLTNRHNFAARYVLLNDTVSNNTSVAYRMLDTRYELLARDSACNFLFSYIKQGFVGFLNKRYFQTSA